MPGSSPRFAPSPFRESGFSMVEVVITIAILTAVTLSSILVAVPVSRQTRLSREVETADAEVRKTLESLLSAPFDEISTRHPAGSASLVSRLKNGRVSIDYPDPAADPLTIAVTLSWDTTDGGSVSRTFYTVRSR